MTLFTAGLLSDNISTVATDANAPAQSGTHEPKPDGIRLVQAPCQAEHPLAVSQSKAGRGLTRSVQLAVEHIDICVSPPKAAAVVRNQERRNASWPSGAELTVRHRQALNNLEPVQAWLQESLQTRQLDQPGLVAPHPDELARWQRETLAWTQKAVEDLARVMAQMEAFYKELPTWLGWLAKVEPSGLLLPNAVVTDFAGFGVILTKPCLNAMEWQLTLAAAGRALEQRWLTASVEHQIAFMSFQRAGFYASTVDTLRGALDDVRLSLSAGGEQPLPAQWSWIDEARQNVTNVSWCVSSIPS